METQTVPAENKRAGGIARSPGRARGFQSRDAVNVLF